MVTKMCGIVGFFSKKKKIKIAELFKYAYDQKHRGESDGFGLIYVHEGRLKVIKSLLTLSEVIDNKIDFEKRKEEKTTKINLLESLKKLSEIIKLNSSLCILHHRKASHGNVNLDNTHPFSIKGGIKYIHNGSLTDFSSLKRYLNLNSNIRFNSETDSELVANIIEEFLNKWDYAEDGFLNLYSYLSKIFLFFGIIIRIDLFLKNRLDIISSGDRSMFIYELKDAILFISEPILNTKLKITNISKVTQGTINIDLNKNSINFNLNKKEDNTLQRVIEVKKILAKSKLVTLEICDCDSCKTKKLCLKDFRLVNTKNIILRQNICLNCFLYGNLKNYEQLKEGFSYDLKNEIENLETITKNSFPNFNSQCEACYERLYNGDFICNYCPNRFNMDNNQTKLLGGGLK